MDRQISYFADESVAVRRMCLSSISSQRIYLFQSFEKTFPLHFYHFNLTCMTSKHPWLSNGRSHQRHPYFCWMCMRKYANCSVTHFRKRMHNSPLTMSPLFLFSFWKSWFWPLRGEKAYFTPSLQMKLHSLLEQSRVLSDLDQSIHF